MGSIAKEAFIALLVLHIVCTGHLEAAVGKVFGTDVVNVRQGSSRLAQGLLSGNRVVFDKSRLGALSCLITEHVFDRLWLGL